MEGRLSSNGVAMSGPVVLRLEVLDASMPTCVLYREQHSVNLTSNAGAPGFYAVALGAGSSALAGASPLRDVFANGVSLHGDANNDNTIDGADAACDFSAANGSYRTVRLSVSTDAGSSWTTLSPDTAVTASPTAMVANSLQGKQAADFLQAQGANLNQTNLNSLFSTANYQRLLQLLSPTASVGFGGQQISNLGDPSAGQDAATKNYADTKLAGQSINFTGFSAATDGGKVLMWDQVANTWTLQMPSTTDVTKLPLAGGTMSGGINMGGQTLSNANVAIGTTGMLYIRRASGGGGAIGLGGSHAGALYYDSANNYLEYWDGATAIRQAYLDGSGKLDPNWLPTISGTTPGGLAGGSLAGTYPNPSVAAAAIGTTELKDDSILTGKINSGGIAPNRLLLTGGVYGEKLEFKDCANDEVLKFQIVLGWTCASVASLAPVTTVAGKSGAVTLNANDISGVKTAALYDVGIGASNVPLLGGGGQLPLSTIPSLGGDVTGSLTSTVINKLRGVPLAGVAPVTGQALIYNGAQWAAANTVDTGLTGLSGDVVAMGTSGTATATIQNGVITSSKMAALAIGTTHLQNSAVTNAKIDTVGVEKIASSAGNYFTYKPNGASCADGEMLAWSTSGWACSAAVNWASGRLGVGVTAPTAPLHVKVPGYAQAAQFDGFVIVGTSSPGAPTALTLTNTDKTATSAVGLNFQGANVLGAVRDLGRISAMMTGNASGAETGALAFYTRQAGTLNEGLRIDANGNVGIGTIQPGAKLEVASAALANIGLFNTNAPNGRYYSLSSRVDGAFELTDESAGQARLRVSKDGFVAIGDTVPIAQLHIMGDVVQTVTNANSSTSIDFSNSNLQYTTANCQLMNLSGIKNGGTYILAVQGSAAGTCDFSLPSGFTLRKGSAVMATTASKHILFTFIVLGGNVYVASADNY